MLAAQPELPCVLSCVLAKAILVKVGVATREALAVLELAVHHLLQGCRQRAGSANHGTVPQADVTLKFSK